MFTKFTQQKFEEANLQANKCKNKQTPHKQIQKQQSTNKKQTQQTHVFLCLYLLAHTGALYVMMCYYTWSPPQLFEFLPSPLILSIILIISDFFNYCQSLSWFSSERTSRVSPVIFSSHVNYTCLMSQVSSKVHFAADCLRDVFKNQSHGKCPWWGGYPPFLLTFFL